MLWYKDFQNIPKKIDQDVTGSVPDPDPHLGPDPYVFRPPKSASGSISHSADPYSGPSLFS